MPLALIVHQNEGVDAVIFFVGEAIGCLHRREGARNGHEDARPRGGQKMRVRDSDPSGLRRRATRGACRAYSPACCEHIGEITYRGEVHRGEHEPILSRDLFEAVQAKRAANAVDRQVRLRGSAAILTRRLFDDRGNRMSPTHTNKQGARYRYYVSHALLQNRKAEAGSIARVPAPEIESLMCNGVRRHLGSMAEAGPPTALADRDLIERHVARVIVTPQALEVRLNPAGEQAEDPSASELEPAD